MMEIPLNISPSATSTEIFEALQQILESYQRQGKILHAPAAKKRLLQEFPDFSERDLGAKKFIDVLRAGAAEGYIGLEIVDGHPRIVPPGEKSAGREAWDESSILRPDLWSTVVNWSEGSRYWDAARSRPIFIPTDALGRPLWEVEPEKFPEILPVSRDLQMEWMKDFVNSLESPARDELDKTLQDGAHGAFKRGLHKHGLQSLWSSTLQRRVLKHTFDWAEEHGVPTDSLLEPHANLKSPESKDASLDSGTKSVPPREPSSELQALRSRLHAVIDQMSFAELAALEVPAGHLFSL